MEKKQILFLLIRKMTNSLSKTFVQFVVRSLNVLFITNRFISLKKTTLCHQSNLDSSLGTHALINYWLYKSFDDGYKVMGVFLYISKIFNKVWHKGFIYNLKQDGISEKLLNLITDFCSNRKQRVVPNGKYFLWTNIEAGVPQGSILGPIVLLKYINDLSDN